MKLLSYLLLGLVVVASPARAEADRAGVVALSASMVKVEAPRPQGGYALGSGVVVGDERVVTNCHVTRNAGEIRVVRGDARWLVKAQTADIYHDLCILQVPGLKGDPVRLGQATRLTPGQSVTALGYTGGIGLQSSGGEVLSLHRMDGSQVVQSSNFFNSGASGGGLFDDDLKLVGILTFRLRGGEAHYFAAPVEWLVRQLDQPAQKVEPAAVDDLAYWQRPLDIQPNFLRAQVMERDHDWAALEPLAESWTQTDPTDPEPWFVLGVALGQQDRPVEASRALECALVLDPGFAAARVRLAPLRPPAGERATSRVAGAACASHLSATH